MCIAFTLLVKNFAATEGETKRLVTLSIKICNHVDEIYVKKCAQKVDARSYLSQMVDTYSR